IRMGISELEAAGSASAICDGAEEAAEGRLLTRVHRMREMNSAAATSRKRQALEVTGALACEGCGFDFALAYGKRGSHFIECHYTKPVYVLEPSEHVRPLDFALLCSNCHRMVHASRPWLKIEELRDIVRAARSALIGKKISPRSV